MLVAWVSDFKSDLRPPKHAQSPIPALVYLLLATYYLRAVDLKTPVFAPRCGLKLSMFFEKILLDSR